MFANERVRHDKKDSREPLEKKPPIWRRRAFGTSGFTFNVVVNDGDRPRFYPEGWCGTLGAEDFCNRCLSHVGPVYWGGRCPKDEVKLVSCLGYH